jgi:hypothetical protein
VSGLVFFSLAENEAEARNVGRFVRSLRCFGERWRDAPVWCFSPSPEVNEALKASGVRLLPLIGDLPDYEFAGKVAAAAQAEELAGNVDSLVWFNPECLALQPPELLVLEHGIHAAFRPVHLRNIGQLPGQPRDALWSGIYAAAGLPEPRNLVETYIESQLILPYFNTHLYAIRPALGLLGSWWALFQRLVAEDRFQAIACGDDLHRLFLHQAVLSALLAPQRLRLLPPTYSYPLHLHRRVPIRRRPKRLDELVCPVYEDEFHYPETLNGLAAGPELESFLRELNN